MKLTRQQFLKALPASALLLAGCAAKQTAPANTEALVFDHAYPLDYARQFTADCYEGGSTLLTLTGSGEQFLVLPEDAADKTITWTSADESVATIDDSGVITTHAPGQTTITAASTAGGVSTTYNLVVQEVVKCSYCGGTGHTADTCAVKKTAEQQAAAQAAEQAAAAQAAEQPAAEAAQPADPGYAVTAKGDRIYPEGSPDIPEGGVVQRPDGTFYVKGPRNVIFGYEEGEPDPNMPPWTGDCVFCGDFGHDVYHCPILDAQENPDAFLMD